MSGNKQSLHVKEPSSSKTPLSSAQLSWNHWKQTAHKSHSSVDLGSFLSPYECWQIAHASWITCAVFFSLGFCFFSFFFPPFLFDESKTAVASQTIGRRFGPLAAGGWAFSYWKCNQRFEGDYWLCHYFNLLCQRWWGYNGGERWGGEIAGWTASCRGWHGVCSRSSHMCRWQESTSSSSPSSSSCGGWHGVAGAGKSISSGATGVSWKHLSDVWDGMNRFSLILAGLNGYIPDPRKTSLAIQWCSSFHPGLWKQWHEQCPVKPFPSTLPGDPSSLEPPVVFQAPEQCSVCWLQIELCEGVD